MAGGPRIRNGRCCLSTQDLAGARPHALRLPSGHANEGLRPSSLRRARAWKRWPGEPWPMVRTRWGWPVATGRWRSWPRRPPRMGFRSFASRPGPATTSLSISGLDPHDVLGALDAFTDGIERRIDVADVNGRVFLNNVSLGIYGDAVRSPAYRDAKIRTLLETAEKVLGPSAEVPALRLVDDVGREHPHLAVVLVSNNPYMLDRPLVPGARPALDSGRLGIIVLDAPAASPRHPPGRAWSAPRLEVSAPAPVHAGIDGEAVDLSPPLQFTIRPGALRVRISSRHPGISPSARFPSTRQPRPPAER